MHGFAKLDGGGVPGPPPQLAVINRLRIVLSKRSGTKPSIAFVLDVASNSRSSVVGLAAGYLYSSAVARAVPLVPPVTRTVPSLSKVAVCDCRVDTILPVGEKVPAVGS